MGFEQWESQYQGLKAQLEDAYAQPDWDSAQIDRIAAELARVENRLAHGAGAAHGQISQAL